VSARLAPIAVGQSGEDVVRRFVAQPLHEFSVLERYRQVGCECLQQCQIFGRVARGLAQPVEHDQQTLPPRLRQRNDHGFGGVVGLQPPSQAVVAGASRDQDRVALFEHPPHQPVDHAVLDGFEFVAFADGEPDRLVVAEQHQIGPGGGQQPPRAGQQPGGKFVEAIGSFAVLDKIMDQRQRLMTPVHPLVAVAIATIAPASASSPTPRDPCINRIRLIKEPQMACSTKPPRATSKA
jgi:hypothetical protein